jgi:hypothetical protein
MDLAGRLSVAMAAALLSACTHQMTIVNAKDYEVEARPVRSLILAVQGDTIAEDTTGLVDAVQQGLAAQPSVERVWKAKEVPPGIQPDYVVLVRPTTSYEGSGWNYPITFPGFLVFTHSWNGYVYKANVTTELELRRPGSEEAVATQTVDTHWDLRHCDFERGAWNSSGWYTPGYGGLNLILGFFMMRYDPDATPEFVRTATLPYGRFIAVKVLDMTAAAPASPAAIGEAEPSAAVEPSASPQP